MHGFAGCPINYCFVTVSVEVISIGEKKESAVTT
jgi:hypothetical protein